jgi:hypothetical protein
MRLLVLVNSRIENSDKIYFFGSKIYLPVLNRSGDGLLFVVNTLPNDYPALFHITKDILNDPHTKCRASRATILSGRGYP